MTVKLSDREILFKGGNRLCFLHPDDANKILKVLRPEKKPELRRKQVPLYKKIRPLSAFNINLKELKAYHSLNKKGNGIWKHFPKCFGMMETDMGSAVCQELIKEKDGSIPITLMEYIQKNGFTREIEKAMGEFFSFLLENLIVTRDLHGKNLILKKKNGGFRIYMIDGIGNSDFIPIANVSKTWARRKITRNLKELRNKLEKKASEKL